MSSTAPARRIAAVVGALVIIAGLINLLGLRPFLLAVPHGFLLPAPVQIAAMLAALGVLGIVATRAADWQPARGWRWLALLLLLILLAAWRTTYPSIHGDGENGAPGHASWAQLRDLDPTDSERRLSAHLSRTLAGLFPHPPAWTCHVGMPERSNPFPTFDQFRRSRQKASDTWILLVLSAGALLALTISIAASRLPAPGTDRLGLALFLLFSPPMLNFFGHFDSYWLSVLLVLAWSACLHRAASSSRLWTWLAVAAALAATAAHPALILLPMLTCLHLILEHLDRRQVGHDLLRPALLAGGILGLLPLLVPGAHAAEWAALRPGLLARFIAERAMLISATALPALLLAALVLHRARRALRKPSPLAATAVAALLAALLSGFTLNYTLGPLDELNIAAVQGTLALAAAWLLWRLFPPGDRAILCIGLLSLLWFLPRAYVYSGENIIRHFRVLQPLSVCDNNRSVSPTLLLALRCPPDTPRNQQHLLDLLHEGAAAPAPLWTGFRPLNLSYEAAWSYEFGRLDHGRDLLHWHLAYSPTAAAVLWLDGARLTSRHENRAAPLIRRDSLRWILDHQRAHPGNPVYPAMHTLLRKCQRGDITPADLQAWGNNIELH